MLPLTIDVGTTQLLQICRFATLTPFVEKQTLVTNIRSAEHRN